MDNKGVSLVALVVTIIVIIIIASISMMSSMKTIDEATKVKFENDLKETVTALEVYNQRANIRGIVAYNSKNLTWDGISESAENTAQIEEKGREDTIKEILEGDVPNTLKGIITIENGRIKVDKNQKPQIDWAIEMYSYMGE